MQLKKQEHIWCFSQQAPNKILKDTILALF